jgi:hypothetical protein
MTVPFKLTILGHEDDPEVQAWLRKVEELVAPELEKQVAAAIRDEVLSNRLGLFDSARSDEVHGRHDKEKS